MPAPLLLLDVNGVLNALGPRTTGAEWRRATAQADGARWPDDLAALEALLPG